MKTILLIPTLILAALPLVSCGHRKKAVAAPPAAYPVATSSYGK